ncbi:glutamate racemase [Shewanella maritima]|uniref:glutamate racemase n=1 Tax=Shewanella maritima TaxID=2520507 RepID=UPI0037353B40
MSECDYLNQPVLIFDSGVGGLSIVEHIKQALPQQDIFYLFDNARLPYGDLEEADLISGCVKLIVEQANDIDAICVVVACNTASTVVLDELRRQLAIPIVGVVPAIKPAALQSKTKHIALLATPGTVTRSYTQELIKQYASGCEVALLGSSELVMMAEQKLDQCAIDVQRLKQILSPINKVDIDTIVLGCTHFPLLADEISQCFDTPVSLMDSGSAIAARVVSLIDTDLEVVVLGRQAKMMAGYTEMISTGVIETLANYGINKHQLLPQSANISY